MTEKVTLLVYDISQGMAKAMGQMLIGQYVEALYHTAIVVFGRQYYFGGGICNDLPRSTPYGKPFSQVELGQTQLPKQVFEDYLKDINHKYTADKYDVINFNCNMFTNDISQFLTGKGIGDKYVHQARDLLQTPGGQMFKPFITQMQGSIQNPPPGFYN